MPSLIMIRLPIMKKVTRGQTQYETVSSSPEPPLVLVPGVVVSL
jgi:hypothetical protein